MGLTTSKQAKGAAALEQQHTYTLNDVLGLGFEARCAAVDGTRYLWHGKCGLRVDSRSGTTTMIMDPRDCLKDRGPRPCGAKRRSERGQPASALAAGERRRAAASLRSLVLCGTLPSQLAWSPSLSGDRRNPYSPPIAGQAPAAGPVEHRQKGIATCDGDTPITRPTIADPLLLQESLERRRWSHRPAAPRRGRPSDIGVPPA